MSNLVQSIEAHPALRHPLFQKMAEAKLSLRYRELFLYEMGDFCAASRQFYHLAETLQKLGHEDVAEVIHQISASEAGHAEQFEVMAQAIIDRPIFSSSHTEKFDETMDASRHFMKRAGKTKLFVDYSLGILVAIEMLANRHIIPGEIQAFITAGHYGPSLDDPAMAYLKDHAGEHGAEAEHESIVLKHVLKIENEAMLVGALEFLDDVNRWYDSLMNIISIEPPNTD